MRITFVATNLQQETLLGFGIADIIGNFETLLSLVPIHADGVRKICKAKLLLENFRDLLNMLLPEERSGSAIHIQFLHLECWNRFAKLREEESHAVTSGTGIWIGAISGSFPITVPRSNGLSFVILS